MVPLHMVAAPVSFLAWPPSCLWPSYGVKPYTKQLGSLGSAARKGVGEDSRLMLGNVACSAHSCDWYMGCPHLCRDGQVSVETSLLIEQLIELDSSNRLTVSRALETVQSILLRM